MSRLARSHQTRRLSRDAGYTLTEMLVVIGIIGLIAAALTPALIGQLSRARVKTAKLQLQTVESALESYRSDVGEFPPKIDGLGALIQPPTGVEGWLGPYLHDPHALKDPWGRAILYKVDPTGDHASIISLGSDGKVGGTGMAADIEVRG